MNLNFVWLRVSPRWLVLLLLLIAAPGCQQQEHTTVAAPVETPVNEALVIDPSELATRWDQLVENFIDEFFVAHPTFAVTAGRHEFDGKLPDWSAAGIAAEIERLHAIENSAKAFADDQLDRQRRYQKSYLLSRVKRDLFWLEKARWPFRSPAFYFDWLSDSLDPDPYISRRYAAVEIRMQAYINFAKGIPQAAAQIQSNLQAPMPRTWIEYAVASFGGMGDYFDADIKQAFTEVKDEALWADFKQANGAAAKAMHELANYFIAMRGSATEDFALGEELFSSMINDTEMVDLSLAQMLEIGHNDMARNQRALAETCAEYAPGESIEDCFARMANHKPKDGAVIAAREQLKETKAFLIEKDLVSIPGIEECAVEEAPPYARSNFAYIAIPGPYETGEQSTYFIAPPDPSWPEAEQQAYIPGDSDLLLTSVHEVWPGHFLNFLHANRSDWQFGRVFVGYAFAEGWAHYTEEMMYDAGLRNADAETRIGMLSNALLRNARFISAIGLHSGTMTVEESEKLFLEEAHQDAGTARQQAARGTYDPAYLNYTMGKLMIRQLRDDWLQAHDLDPNNQSNWKAFHDAFLSYGGPPIPLVREQMLNAEPKAVFYQPDAE